VVIWFIGKSASGKTYIGKKLYQKLKLKFKNLVFLDGDSLREILSKDLGYSKNDRFTSEERRSRLSKMLSDQNIHVIVSGISNEPKIREWNRNNIDNYFEIYLETTKTTLYSRDPKGIYKDFIKGELKNVVGEDIKFNVPISPWIKIDNNKQSSEDIINIIMKKLEKIKL